MRCPACGSWNKSEFAKCYSCGQPLHDAPSQPTRRAAHKVERIEEPEDLRDLSGEEFLERIREKQREQQQTKGGAAARSLPRPALRVLPREEEPVRAAPVRAAPVRATPVRAIPARTQTQPRKTPPPARARERFDDEDDAPRYRQRKAPGRAKSTLSRVLLSLVVLLALMLFVWYGLQWAQQAVNSQNQQSTGYRTPLILPVTVDENPATQITFFGKEGGFIYIEELGKSYPIIAGEASVTIPDSYWYPLLEKEEDEIIKVPLSPTYVTLAGEKTPLEKLTVSIPVPLSPLTITRPENPRTEVSVAMYIIQAKVVPGSKVSVNGKNISDLVDAEGNIMINHPIEPIGDNVVEFSVRTSNHRENKRRLIFYSPKMEVPIELDINTVDSTVNGDLTLSGHIPKGATLKVDSKAYLEDQSTIDSARGSFQLKFKMKLVGENIIRLTASLPGKSDSMITHRVHYMPTMDKYSRMAWVMDYKDIVSSNDIRVGRVYRCDGPVTRIEEDNPQTFVMNVGTADNPQLIYMVNNSTNKVEVGKNYKIFADVRGMHEDIPEMSARLVYEKK